MATIKQVVNEAFERGEIISFEELSYSNSIFSMKNQVTMLESLF